MNTITCPNCGCQTNNQQCPNCGTVLYQQQAQQNNYMPYAQPQQQINHNYQQTNNRAYYNNQALQQNYPQYNMQQQYYQQPIPTQQNNTLYYIAVALGIIASIICAISVALPYYTVSAFGVSQSKALIEGSDGLLIIGISLVPLLFSLPNSKQKKLGIGQAISALILFALAFAEVNIVEDSDGFKEYSYLYHKGAGFYMLIIGSILVLIAGALFSEDYNIKKKKSK